MNKTCDRCGTAVRAAYFAIRGGQLQPCQHRTAQPLRAQGQAIWPAGQSLSGRTAA